MNPEHTIEIGGKSYPLIFNTHAICQLEAYLRREDLGTLNDIFGRMSQAQVSLLDLQVILWASLEGYRRKHKTRSFPYTMDEVCNLLDSHGGGLQGLTAVLVEAVRAAFPQTQAASDANVPDENAADPAVGEPEKNAQASATGTRSRSKRPALA